MTDIQRIRESRFFKALPDRAFDRLMAVVKVRAYEAGEEVVGFERSNEFENCYGYLVSGAILLLDEEGLPLGVSLRDELFLTRKFTLGGQKIHSLIAVDPRTFVVYVPRNVISILVEASSSLADAMEEIYDAVVERSLRIRADTNGSRQVQSWIKFKFYDRILSEWVNVVEEKRRQSLKGQQEDRKKRKRARYLNIGILLSSLVVLKLVLISRPGTYFFQLFGAYGSLALRGFYWGFYALSAVICAGALIDLYLQSDSAMLQGEKIEVEKLEDHLSRVRERPRRSGFNWRKLHRYTFYIYLAVAAIYIVF